MEIEIPNRTSNGYYNVKKYIVIRSKFGSKTAELEFGKINGQEKKIQVQLQEAEWGRMKENYFSPDNLAANLVSDKFHLHSEEWISPEQNKYHLIKFVQKDNLKPPFPYSLTVSEYHNLMKLFPVIDISLGLCRLERIGKKYFESSLSSKGNFAIAPRNNKEEDFDWEQFRRDMLGRSDKLVKSDKQ